MADSSPRLNPTLTDPPQDYLLIKRVNQAETHDQEYILVVLIPPPFSCWAVRGGWSPSQFPGKSIWCSCTNIQRKGQLQLIAFGCDSLIDSHYLIDNPVDGSISIGLGCGDQAAIGQNMPWCYLILPPKCFLFTMRCWAVKPSDREGWSPRQFPSQRISHSCTNVLRRGGGLLGCPPWEVTA